MTREDAIKIFLNRGWIEIEGRIYFDGDKWREAIMVISDYFRNEYKALQQEPSEDMGEVSDSYHTFNQLYHQRAILFATIVNQNKDISWKSYKHSDGNYCFDSNGEWFIVGIDTPEGSYTYHYSKEYWDYFKCKELDCGKEWDGHTEEDVTRLLSLERYDCEDCISRQAVLDKEVYTETSDGWTGWTVDVNDIKELPPVTPQQKMGHWITKGGKGKGYDIAGGKTWYIQIMCDKCGFIKTAIEGHMGQYQFCPKCGQPKIQEVKNE